MKPCRNIHKCRCKPTQWSVQLVKLKRHVLGGRSDIRRPNPHHSVGLTWQLPARAGTDGDSVPVSSQWVISLFSNREGIQRYPHKEILFREEWIRCRNVAESVTEQHKGRNLHSKFCPDFVSSCISQRTSFLYSDENKDFKWTCVTLKVDDSFMSSCCRILIPLLNFIIISAFKMNSACISTTLQISTLGKHRWADLIPPCSS